MNLVWTLLQRLRLVNSFEPRDVDRAEADNAMTDHGRILEQVKSSSQTLRATQNRLLASIEEARRSTEVVKRKNHDAIATLVHDMRSSGEFHPRN